MFTILAAAYLVASPEAPGLPRASAAGCRPLGAPHAGRRPRADGADRRRRRRRRLDRRCSSPALLLDGAGMGLVHHAADLDRPGQLEPEHAGAASGALATMQQVGNALGVAVTGVIFFGALDRGFGHAFELSLIQLARARPRGRRADAAAAAPRGGVSPTGAGARRARA